MDRLTEEESKRLGSTWDSISPKERTEILENASREDKVLLNKWNLLHYINENRGNEKTIEYLITTTDDMDILQKTFIEYINQQNENKQKKINVLWLCLVAENTRPI